MFGALSKTAAVGTLQARPRDRPALGTDHPVTANLGQLEDGTSNCLYMTMTIFNCIQ